MSDRGEAGDRKERLVREVQERRGFEEPYGRSAGQRFSGHDHPHSYPIPEILDWRRALRAYVSGHDRNWEADRKFAEAAEHPDDAPGTDRGEEPGEATEAEADDDAEGAAGPRFGVGIPDREDLEFHRGASIWRDELPGAGRMPRHTDRELDGQRGRGEQA